MITVTLHFSGAEEKIIRDVMAERGISGRAAVLALVTQNMPDPVSYLETINLSAADPLPPEYGRRGYFTTLVRYIGSNMSVGQSVLVESLTDQHGKHILPNRAGAYFTQCFGAGKFSTSTAGLSDGQFILTRKA